MILDNLTYAGDYVGLSENFKKAFEFLTTHDLSAMPLGRTDIDGDNVYIIIQEPALKPWSQGKWEAHRRYADIQTVIAGSERIGYRKAKDAAELVPYDFDNDVVFFGGDDGDSVTLHEGDFMVLMPQDLHRPCIETEDGRKSVRKAVVKIKLCV